MFCKKWSLSRVPWDGARESCQFRNVHDAMVAAQIIFQPFFFGRERKEILLVTDGVFSLQKSARIVIETANDRLDRTR